MGAGGEGKIVVDRGMGRGRSEDSHGPGLGQEERGRLSWTSAGAGGDVNIVLGLSWGRWLKRGLL